ncbi:MAG: LodA/GoxA family CTQ-dependent oxidase [Planctomyces sp.]|nr:LodA/GoxA family CTQ-dependent oxidase [Planctomyces sp.]
MITKYRIHPSIGIARIGNSANDWFDGPDVPSLAFTPPGGAYRDASGRIKRQAAKFRIYESTYDPTDLTHPVSVREITSADAEIEWHVQLANLKSFERDPAGGGNVPVPNSPPTGSVRPGDMHEIQGSVFGHNLLLGRLMTDDDGRLRVLGGLGRSESPSGEPLVSLFNPGWYDDVSDGPVRATIRLHGTNDVPVVESAWVVVGVPAYAHPVVSIVTMWDLAYDIAVRHFGHPLPVRVSFTRDIYPILQRTVLMQWASGLARVGHGPGRRGDFLEPALLGLLASNDSAPGSPARAARERVFDKLRNPLGGTGGNMPRLPGPPSPVTPNADGFTVTQVQFDLMQRWRQGSFDPDWAGPPPEPVFSALSPAEQTAALDHTGLWTGVGGSFLPGIEVSSAFAQWTTYASPFRIQPTLPAGTLTAGLSVPWQADFTACGSNYWPGARPNEVTDNGTAFHQWTTYTMPQMVADWWKLGFLAWRPLQSGVAGILETEKVVP